MSEKFLCARSGSGDERYLFQPVKLPRLADEMIPLGGKQRQEDAVRFGSRKIRERGAHVRVALADSGDGDNFAAECAEGVGEGRGETVRDRVAVVNGRHPPQAQLVIGEMGDCLGLIETIAVHAKVAGMVVRSWVAREVRREIGRRICGRDRTQTRGAEHGRGTHRRLGTRRADDAYHLRVGSDLTRTLAAALA